MKVAWPLGLWLLLLVPLVLALYILVQRRRQRYPLRYSSLTLLRPAISRPRWQRHIPPALFLLALSALILAITRPAAPLDDFQQESAVILTVDVSGSMRETDLRPTRLEAAKDAARVFIQEQPPHVRVGLVAFTDYIAVQVAPTSDHNALLASLNSLAPLSGTAIGDGILASLKAISEWESAGATTGRAAPTAPALLDDADQPAATIVLLTDGQSNAGIDTLEAARQAAARGTRVYTVGLASTARSVFRVGGRSFPGDIDEALLKRVAEITHAEYLYADTEEGLLKIYQKLGTQISHRPVETELTFVLAGLGAGLFILSLVLAMAYQVLG